MSAAEDDLDIRLDSSQFFEILKHIVRKTQIVQYITCFRLLHCKTHSIGVVLDQHYFDGFQNVIGVQ
jgi:hypothetical protein